MREKLRPKTNRKETYQEEKNLSTACRNERLEEQQTTEITEQQKKEEKTSNDGKYGKTEEIASKGCGNSKNDEKKQEKELGCAEREDHRRAEGPRQQRQFLATATPGQSWPADGGQHIDVVRLTTADFGTCKIALAIDSWKRSMAMVSCWEHSFQTGAQFFPSVSQHAACTILSNLLASFDLHQMVSEVTRPSGEQGLPSVYVDGTLLDLIITNRPAFFGAPSILPALPPLFPPRIDPNLELPATLHSTRTAPSSPSSAV